MRRPPLFSAHDNSYLIVNIGIFILLLAASAFFSSSETAFLSLGKIRRRQIARMDNPSAKRVTALLSDPARLLVTILIGNTLVNIAASAIMTDISYDALGEKGVGISIILMTVIVLLFGEVTPKKFALSHSRAVSFFAAMPVTMIEKVIVPLRLVLTGVSYFIVRGLGVHLSSEDPGMTAQEIRSLLSLSRKKGVVKKKEKDMIDGILEFKELNAADIMTPRIDMVALDLTEKKDNIILRIKESQCSRIPVYMHTLDNVVGVIHSKDLLLDLAASVKDLVRRPYFVPESMRIDDLLQELLRRHIHMAVVTDEYGVTSGLVTIEDVLEEIVGEIRDEFDFEVPQVRKIDRKNFEVEGQTHIDEVNEKVGLSIDTDEVDTIGGYITLVLGRIPQAGDTFEGEGFVATVNDVSKNRITTLRIEKT